MHGTSLAATEINPPRQAPRRPVRLRALLYEASWHRADLARALGMPASTTSRVFDGVRPLKLAEAVRLASALSEQLARRVTPEDLLDEEM